MEELPDFDEEIRLAEIELDKKILSYNKQLDILKKKYGQNHSKVIDLLLKIAKKYRNYGFFEKSVC